MKHEVILRLDDELMGKLKRLAEYRKMSPEDCMLSFIQTSQPGGSGWEHPDRASQKINAKGNKG